MSGKVFGGARCIEDRCIMQLCILYDLGGKLARGAASRCGEIRVTMLNPDLLHRTHAAHWHQYLIAREILDADLVIKLPKLKAHK